MRSSPIPRVNKERQAKRKAEGLVYGPLHEWTKRQRCILFGRTTRSGILHSCGGYTDSHHVKSVGSGGQDKGNTLPVCILAHREFHSYSLPRMCERYIVDFKALACEVTAQWEASL